MSERELKVFVRLDGTDIVVGRLWSRESQGRPSTSTFVYSDDWHRHPRRFELSPALPLVAGQQNVSRALPGAFTDCAPDSWGQKLMRRGERMKAEKAGRKVRTLLTVDCLAGVDDASRMGALRFTDPDGSTFLAATGRPVPPLIQLPDLLSAAGRFDRGSERDEDIALVLDPGASFGGARPKASVRDSNGALLIAKFTKSDDQWPVITWEAVTLVLAAMAGIETPSWRIAVVATKPVLLLSRFDRSGAGDRLPFMSAMTALDAEDHTPGKSYLNIAEFIRQRGVNTAQDLKQLWRRVVFNTLASNLDDHLRNHAFIYSSSGWKLSPAFDMNPVLGRSAASHKTAIDSTDTTPSMTLVFSVAAKFGLTRDEARKIAGEVASAVAQWRTVAKTYRLNKNALDLMSPAFEHDELAVAQREALRSVAPKTNPANSSEPTRRTTTASPSAAAPASPSNDPKKRKRGERSSKPG